MAKREPRGEMRVSLLCAMQPDQCEGYAIIKDYLRSKYNSIDSLSLRPSTILFNICTLGVQCSCPQLYTNTTILIQSNHY